MDSNFLFIPFQFHVDIFAELEALIGRFEPVVLSTTLEELEALREAESERMRRRASAAFELVKWCKVVAVEKKPGEVYDDVILRVAKEWKSPVATNDAALRKRLREAAVATVFLRQRSRLAVEGYLQH